MATSGKTATRIKPGTWVVLHYGVYDVLALILEDYGPLGGDRRHIYRIRILEDGVPVEFGAVEDDLSPFDQDSFVEYFRGNLASILEHGSPDREPNRVWLTLDKQGELTHTFHKERGMMGGVAVPFHTLEKGRIFLPFTNHVEGFLQEFGLSPGQARDVIQSIGVHPKAPSVG